MGYAHRLEGEHRIELKDFDPGEDAGLKREESRKDGLRFRLPSAAVWISQRYRILMRGRLSCFSADRLLAILNRLGHNVEVRISAKKYLPKRPHARN